MRKRKPGAGRPIQIEGPWREIAICLGGSSKLAQTLGVSNSTIARWAHGHHRVPLLAIREIERLCKQYGVEFKDFNF